MITSIMKKTTKKIIVDVILINFIIIFIFLKRINRKLLA